MDCIFRDTDGGEIIANTYGDVDAKKIDKIIQKDGVYLIKRYSIIQAISENFLCGNFRLNITSFTKIKKMPPDEIFNNINFHFLMIEDIFFLKKDVLLILVALFMKKEMRVFIIIKGLKY